MEFHYHGVSQIIREDKQCKYKNQNLHLLLVIQRNFCFKTTFSLENIFEYLVQDK